MTATLNVLDSVVARYGRDAVSDPVALEAALHAATDPPAAAEIAALTRVAGTAALDRMRAAVDRGDSADQALAAGLSAVDEGDPDLRRAAVLLGAALGYLPRDRVPAPGAAPVAAAAAPRRSRRGAVVAVLAAAVILAAGAAVVVLVPRPDGEPTVDPVAAPVDVPVTTGAPTTAPTPTGAPDTPSDPLAAFTDPGLRAFAEPYLRSPDALCEAGIQSVNTLESVACQLGGGQAALFTKPLNVDLMKDLRGGYLSGSRAEPGTVRSLRWRFVDAAAGTRIGIPTRNPDPGEGLRIRFVSAEGTPFLYFDQDSTGSSALFGLAAESGDPAADLDALRSYWAAPNP